MACPMHPHSMDALARIGLLLLRLAARVCGIVHGGGWVAGRTITDRQASRLQYARSITRGTRPLAMKNSCGAAT
jgi:hypothetical protein